MLNYHLYGSQDAYVNAVVSLISSLEGQISSVTDIGDGKATIGYGYTFNRSDNLALWTASGISLTTAERTALQNIDNASSANRTSLALSQFTRSITKAEAQLLLKQTYQQYEGPAIDLGMPFSSERAAFVSITYNRGITAVRNKMQQFYADVTNGNRADAWFQIRYNSQTSNPLYVNGIANRRYQEAALFGLYNSGTPTVDEAKQVYAMFTQNRSTILQYEQSFPPPPTIWSIADALDSAKTTLINYLQGQYSDELYYAGAPPRAPHIQETG